ncbi:DUF4843 domain-containing protein [Prevotella sp. KH2C16]|uniref:DUF4843 domain-containing protein n=1 Tax=Prevotella sp. KH2C16 TaxID=1855325 RepID=UPI0008DF0942|nr:DUF4843 domain-containing protein [Prevotella sp. KH2C16]SFG60894.1 protein of unknown function [Prevotella sp. KH2C16]
MKYLISNIILTMGLGLTLCACSHEEIEVYGANGDGVYFNYDNVSALQQTINFADYVLGNPASLPVTLKLKVMGLKAGTDRKVVLKSKALGNHPQLQVEFPVVVFAPDTMEKVVTVNVMRPEVRDTDYVAVVYIANDDPESQIGAGVKGFQEYVIHATESFSKPKEWDAWGMIQMYLGDWSVDKHIFLVNLTQNNTFYKSNDYYKIVQWNQESVDSLRIWKQSHLDDPVTVDIPFITEDGFNYPKPWYWNQQIEQYLGAYRSSNFAAICNALGVTTRNEYETFHTDVAGLKQLNSVAVSEMMEKYNMFYYDGWRPGDSYKGYFYIPMFADVDYDVVEPAAWSDSSGGSDMIEQYYGPYSEAKYKFMIKTWLKEKGSSFVLNQMFPVMNEWGSVSWDMSIGGEDAIKACNELFRSAMVGGSYDFTFPVIE